MNLLEHIKNVREKKAKVEKRQSEHDSFIDEFFKSVEENIIILSSGYTTNDNQNEDKPINN